MIWDAPTALPPILVVVMLVSPFTDGTDPRLASVTKAFVTPFDPLGDDKPVAECFADHLANTTPLTAVDSRDKADLLISIRAHFPGKELRPLVGGQGGNARLVATLPNGTKLWSGIKSFSASQRRSTPSDISCFLADGIAEELRQAIRRARDALRR